ncbi:MAG: hypothetical protein ACI4JM_06235, partial [Oscillospiraceae bacterium]
GIRKLLKKLDQNLRRAAAGIFVILFTCNIFHMARPHRLDYLVPSVNKIKLTNVVEPVNKAAPLTKPLKAACYEPEAVTHRSERRNTY